MNHIQTGSQLSQYPLTNFAKTALRLQSQDFSTNARRAPCACACATSPVLGAPHGGVAALTPLISGIWTSKFTTRTPAADLREQGMPARTVCRPGGERGETRVPQGLSHAFAHSSRVEVRRPAVPAEEVSITPDGTGLGPFPKSETLPLSSSFTLPLPKLFLFLHPGSASLCTFAT